jgi:hypothetical protein
MTLAHSSTMLVFSSERYFGICSPMHVMLKPLAVRSTQALESRSRITTMRSTREKRRSIFTLLLGMRPMLGELLGGPVEPEQAK